MNMYLDRLAEKLRLAEKVLKRSGVTRHRGGEQLTNPQKQILGDLKSLSGYLTHTCYNTDPISPSEWWRTEPRRRIRVSTVVSSDEEEEERGRGVRERNWFNEESDRGLMDLCERWRRDTGQKRIMWDDAYYQFGQDFPQVICSKDQLQNRYKNLSKGGRV